MKYIIILKGYRNSGKSEILKSHLPPLLGAHSGKRTIYYKGQWILLIRRSIHESIDWKVVIRKICNYPNLIIVIAAWSDEIIHESAHAKERLEDLLNKEKPGVFNFYTYNTEQKNSPDERKQNQMQCAQQIKDCIDNIMLGF